MKLQLLTCTIVLTFSVATAFAEHADVRPYVDDDQIQINGWDDDESLELIGLRVFGYEFGEIPGDPFFAEDPGFNAAPGSGLPPGSQVFFDIPGAAAFGLSSNLSYWDGSGAVVFGSVPSGETLLFSLGSNDLTVGGSSAPQAGFAFSTVDLDGDLHEHLSVFLQGSDGNSAPAGIDGVEAAPGVYLVPMTLRSSDTSISDSSPFFLVYNNGLDEELHDAAIDWAQSNLIVPEPASALLAAMAGFLALVGNRRPTVR